MEQGREILQLKIELNRERQRLLQTQLIVLKHDEERFLHELGQMENENDKS